jgi:hypothetical protein
MCNKYLSGSWDLFLLFWAVSCGQILNAKVLLIILIILFLSLLCWLYLLLLLLVLEVRVVEFWWLLCFRKVDLLLFAWFYIIHFCWRWNLMQLWLVNLDNIGGGICHVFILRNSSFTKWEKTLLVGKWFSDEQCISLFLNLILNIPIFFLLSVWKKKLFREYCKGMYIQKAIEDEQSFLASVHPSVDVHNWKIKHLWYI